MLASGKEGLNGSEVQQDDEEDDDDDEIMLSPTGFFLAPHEQKDD